MSMQWDVLNDRQKMAVMAPLGNALVLAGAGSGKTRVLVNRIAWLIDRENISPHAILAVTFTNKAAYEMKARLQELLSCSVDGLWVGTFHGLCHRMLRRHPAEANLPQGFHILDSDDQARVLRSIITSMNLNTEQWPVKQAQQFINRNKDEGLRPKDIEPAKFGPARTLLKIYEGYEQTCQATGGIDFAELLLRCHEMLRVHENLLLHYQNRFKSIMVDEFQDTNAVQYAWIKLLAGQNSAVMAVGDDDQSIYGWRGAKIENIQKFEQDFANTQIIRLEQNYRSTATILNAANALINNNQIRMGKNLWTDGVHGEKITVFSAVNELEEAHYISDRIRKEITRGRPGDDIAVLYRSNAQSRVLEDALLRLRLAYRIYGGVRFFERAEIKDAIAYLRLLINPDDNISFERIVNFPARGVGDKTLEEVRELANAERLSLWTAAEQLLSSGELASRAATALQKFITLIQTIRTQIQNLPLAEQIKIVLEGSGLYTHFAQAKGDQAESKLENLRELVNAGREFSPDVNDNLPAIVSFLAYASLEAGELQSGGSENGVQLMTLHAAKGLEFPLVFLVGMEEGVFPSRQSVEEPGRLEEERRLCYVGMTRAMEKLIMTYATVRRQYGREEYHRPSRFLKELPKEFLLAV